MSSEIDSALAAYLAPFVAGRRVLYVGDSEPNVVRTLASRAESVRVLDMSSTAGGKGDANVRISPFRGGALSFAEGTFDVALVSQIERLGDEIFAR